MRSVLGMQALAEETAAVGGKKMIAFEIFAGVFAALWAYVWVLRRRERRRQSAVDSIKERLLCTNVPKPVPPSVVHQPDREPIPWIRPKRNWIPFADTMIMASVLFITVVILAGLHH